MTKCNCGKEAMPNTRICEECDLVLGAFHWGF